MSERELDMMERYIYEVVRRVSRDQREGIHMELTELITDMMDEGDSTIEEVLSKLGDPAEFAKQYRDETNYLISPSYYDDYVWVMKIVLICVAGSSLLSAAVQGITEGNFIYRAAYGLIENLVVSCIGAFGIVTFIFAVLERQKVKVELREKKEWTVSQLEKDTGFDKKVWTPKQLSPLPHKKAMISRGESAAGVIFIVIFAVLLIAAPQLLGAYIYDDGEFVKTIPLFNLQHWGVILAVWLFGLAVNFADEMIRLVTGCYCKLVMVSNVLSGVITILTSAIVLKLLPLWNPDFVKEVSVQFDKQITSKGDIFFYYGTEIFSNIILAVICITAFAEMGVTIYKTVKYGTDM